jgi:adenylate cyclase
VNPKKFFAELRRRNVYKVAVAYGVVSWLLIQIATQVFPIFEIPNWAARLIVIVLALGFLVALVLPWAYELTPEGLQRTDEIEKSKSTARRTGRKLDFVIIGVLLAVIAVLGFRHYRPIKPPLIAGVPEKSIAILPFLDLSQTKDQEYFSDGITEEIINSLAHIHGLFVVARTTAFSFKNKNMDIREVGRQLGVSHAALRFTKRLAVVLIRCGPGSRVCCTFVDSRPSPSFFAIRIGILYATTRASRNC